MGTIRQRLQPSQINNSFFIRVGVQVALLFFQVPSWSNNYFLYIYIYREREREKERERGWVQVILNVILSNITLLNNLLFN